VLIPIGNSGIEDRTEHLVIAHPPVERVHQLVNDAFINTDLQSRRARTWMMRHVQFFLDKPQL
jgi:hypothetical protein